MCMIPKPKYAEAKSIFGGTVNMMLERISDKLHAGESLINVKVWAGKMACRLEPREHRQLLIDACNYWADLVAAAIPKKPQPEQLAIER